MNVLCSIPIGSATATTSKQNKEDATPLTTPFSSVPWPENQKTKSQPGKRPFLETAQTVGDRGKWKFPLRYRSTVPAYKSDKKPTS